MKLNRSASFAAQCRDVETSGVMHPTRSNWVVTARFFQGFTRVKNYV